MPINTTKVLKQIAEENFAMNKAAVTKAITNDNAEATTTDNAVKTTTVTTNDGLKGQVEEIINKYALIHAAVAFALGPFAGFALTIITVKMISEICERCGAGIAENKITNFTAHYAGLLAGLAIAQFITGLIPGIGNMSNAVSSFIVTHIIGRAAYASFMGGKLNQNDWKKILDSIFVFKNMSDEDKNSLAERLVIFFAKEDSAEVDKAQKEIVEILTGYGQAIKRDIFSKLKEQFSSKEIQEAKGKIMDDKNLDDKLINIVESDAFKDVTEPDKTKFAMSMAVLVGRKGKAEQRLEAMTKMEEILRKYDITIEF